MIYTIIVEPEALEDLFQIKKYTTIFQIRENKVHIVSIFRQKNY